MNSRTRRHLATLTSAAAPDVSPGLLSLYGGTTGGETPAGRPAAGPGAGPDRTHLPAPDGRTGR
ncbi:hypothetical protein [Streptomyces sp. NPDC001056]